MKATVNLDDRLYRQVEVTAGQTGVTVTSIFEAALRQYLDNPASSSVADVEASFQIPVVDGRGGLLPGVDLANGAEIQDLLDLDTPQRQAPRTTIVSPGSRHWAIFAGLCSATTATGTLVADAFPAALAIESNAVFVTLDRDFARFPGLSVVHPFT